MKVEGNQEIKGVEWGHASGGGGGYVVGYGIDPSIDLLKVHPTDEEKGQPASLIGLKYSYHTPIQNAVRGHGSPKTNEYYTRITMLVAGGPWSQKLWVKALEAVEITLTEPGDFIAWKEPSVQHHWNLAGQSATMVTLTYQFDHDLPADQNAPGLQDVSGQQDAPADA